MLYCSHSNLLMVKMIITCARKYIRNIFNQRNLEFSNTCCPEINPTTSQKHCFDRNNKVVYAISLPLNRVGITFYLYKSIGGRCFPHDLLSFLKQCATYFSVLPIRWQISEPLCLDSDLQSAVVLHGEGASCCAQKEIAA